jgi:UDP-N-acetylmuramoyl-tripeptide--D-alanyl-D-alanine ligase
MGAMMALQLSEAARVLAADHSGADVAFRGIGTDTRRSLDGALFFALQGPNFDGHAFLEAARAQGAVAAAVSRPCNSVLPQLRVPDTRLALGDLSAWWRNRFELPVVAITGSNGKTTVRSMTTAILARCGCALSTEGNLNNDIGLPLTLARLGDEHDFAVIEMGANHPGEIDYLAGIASPTVGVVTNAGPAHLEGFGSLAGVARAKGELFARLAPGATAVINADDAFAPMWRELAAHCAIVEFGLDADCAVSAQWQGTATGSAMQILTAQGGCAVQLPLPGRHNVMNALAATAVALAAGATLDAVRQGLEALTPVGGRLHIHRLPGGIALIDDTYNANPGSLQVALDVLAQAPGARWLVLGDMGELGPEAAALHRDAGRQAAAAAVTHLYTLGELAAHAAASYGGPVTVCSSHDELLLALQADLRTVAAHVLVKGSRRMKMERIVQGLLALHGDNTGTATGGSH